MIRYAHRSNAVRGTVTSSLFLTAAVSAFVAAGCGSGGGGGTGGSGGSKTDTALPKYDGPTTSPDSTPPSPEVGKDSPVVVPETGAGGSGGGIDVAKGSGGNGGVDLGSGTDVIDSGRDVPADQPISPDLPPMDGSGGSPVDGPSPDGGGGTTACPNPVHAWDYPVQELYTVSWDQDGSLITGSEFYPYPTAPINTIPFGGTTLTNAGSSDAVVAKLDPDTGKAKWVFTAGDGSDQTVYGTAATGGNVVAAGVFTGTLDIDPINGLIPPIINASAQAVAYVMGLKDSDGTGVWSKKIDLGTSPIGALAAIAGNPNQAYFLVCGGAMKKPTTLNPTGTLGGGLDVIVAAIKASDGTVMWAKLFGGAMNQSCSAAALDDSGNAYFAGSYAGTLDFGPGALTPAPTGSQDQITWVAKLNGADGTTLAAKAFGTSGKILPASLALDPQGNVTLGGTFVNAVVFGTQTLTPAPAGSSSNSFVAKLDGATLTPSWARGLGGSQTGNSVSGVSVDSTGRIMAVGTYFDSLDAGTSVLQSNHNPAYSDNPVVFALTLDSASGQTLCASSYGDPNSGASSAASIAINRTGTGVNKDRAAIGGYYDKVLNFGGMTTTLSAVYPAPQHDAFLLEL